MNKQGFTTVELILTMVLVMIIMATITNVTYTYRDRSTYEELKNEVTNYKNTTTKIIYDALLDTTDRVIRMEKISDLEYKFYTESNQEKTLTILDESSKVGINFQEDATLLGVDYLVPGSDDSLVSFEGVDYQEDLENNIYSLDIAFSHRNFEDFIRIHLVIS